MQNFQKLSNRSTEIFINGLADRYIYIEKLEGRIVALNFMHGIEYDINGVADLEPFAEFLEEMPVDTVLFELFENAFAYLSGSDELEKLNNLISLKCNLQMARLIK